MEIACSESGCENSTVARGLCSPHYQFYRYHGRLDEVAPAEPRTCAQCGETFDPKHRRWGAMYCSKRCDDNARSARKRAARGFVAEECEHCGTSLRADRRIDARFCSAKCSQDRRNARIVARRLASKAAVPRACFGCGDNIPPERPANALYCSEACKITSRRHEAYGLTKAELGVLLAQHARCAICQAVDWGVKGPQVDHDHATGRVRGVLCNNCNNGLGRFKDDPGLLRAAIVYLEGARVPS